MPYATGTANNATELRTAMTNLATANGWTWDATNEMLHKTPVFGKLTVSGLNLFVQSALGYAGASLTTPAQYGVGISSNLSLAGITVISYPLTYHVFVHANPDVIVLAVNWGSVWWQWLMFGNSTPLGDEPNPLWQFGSASSATLAGYGVWILSNGAASSDYNLCGGAPLFPARSAVGRNSNVYTNIDAEGWSTCMPASVSPGGANAGVVAGPLLTTQPNAWNGEAQLIRLTPMVLRASSFWSYVADLEHLRITRNDAYSDGQIVTVGSDKWFIAPCFRKSSANRDISSGNAGGETANTHSGTMALAIRYDGP